MNKEKMRYFEEMISCKKSEYYKEDLLKNDFTKYEYKLLLEYLVGSIKNNEDWIDHINEHGNC